MSQRIIITGGSGFIGGHLCKALIDDGYEVTVIDIVPPRRAIPRAKYEIFDVRDERKVEKVIANADVVFHFAATVSVPLCEENIVEGYSNNVLGTLSILNAILKSKNFPRIFFSSSAAVYSTACNESVALCEEEGVMPSSHYAFQKRTAEKLIKLFFKKYKIPSLIFRFFNVYGPFQKKDSPYSGVITIFLTVFENHYH